MRFNGNRSLRRAGFILTSIQSTGGRGPAHDGGNGADDGSHPGVGDAHPLHGRVTTRVQENVEGSQAAGERVYPQRQQGDARDSAGGSETDGEQGAAGRAEPHTQPSRITAAPLLLPPPKNGDGIFCYFSLAQPKRSHLTPHPKTSLSRKGKPVLPQIRNARGFLPLGSLRSTNTFNPGRKTALMENGCFQQIFHFNLSKF